MLIDEIESFFRELGERTSSFISLRSRLDIIITTHNPTLFVRLKVEPFEQWNLGPSFKTNQPQRAKFAARNSGTNIAVYNFSGYQLTIRQNRGIRCIGQLEIVESAACKSVSLKSVILNSGFQVW